jgi:hypothetical protein
MFPWTRDTRPSSEAPEHSKSKSGSKSKSIRGTWRRMHSIDPDPDPDIDNPAVPVGWV